MLKIYLTLHLPRDIVEYGSPSFIGMSLSNPGEFAQGEDILGLVAPRLCPVITGDMPSTAHLKWVLA